MQVSMLKAKHKPWAHFIFSRYLNRILKRGFSRFSWEGNLSLDPECSILLLGNHFSWWDGFFLYWLNGKFFKKTFYLMMLERELAPRPFFRYLGAFSMNRSSKSMVETLGYAAGLLQAPGNLVVIFPQGRLESQHAGYVEWQKGTGRILEAAKGMFQPLFSVALIDYWDRRKPAVTIYLEIPHADAWYDYKQLEEAYNDFYRRCKAKQSEIKR